MIKNEVENMTIKEAKELANLLKGFMDNNPVICSSTVEPNPYIGKVCVVRTYSAGVHIGEIISQNGEQVDLKNSRRLWSWKGAFTLSEVSRKGVSKESRIAISIPFMRLTNAIEILPCTNEALKSFEVCHE